jgi:hypothetical protein
LIRNKLLTRFTLLLILISLIPAIAWGWGPEGHTQVGMLALQSLDPTARQRVRDLLTTDDISAINKACNWPDHVRETSEWAWSAPQHYVNIPRSSSHYERQRDCPDGLCVTEAIKKYADQLSDPRLDERKQWEAFAWLCHLMGDLHQPLHAGYRDDLGGNTVEVRFKGESMNLHQFWDRALIRENFKPNGNWQKLVLSSDPTLFSKPWNPMETDIWTDESHQLAGEKVYPTGEVIRADFAENGWILIRQQWIRGGERLAWILNAVVGEGEVEIKR